MADIKPIDSKLNILMSAEHLTVLKAGHSKHNSWWARLFSRWMFIPLETYKVAYFTDADGANDYIEWAANTGPRPNGQRFRTDSLLSGYTRAWVEPFWTRMPIDPPTPKKHLRALRTTQIAKPRDN